MKKSFTIANLVFIALSTLGFSNTIHVPAEQPSIQAGIDAAVNGDTVLVAPGTYVENIHFSGKTISVASSHGPLETVIDGSNPSIPEQGSVVSFNDGEDFNALLQGFTLTLGSGNEIASWYISGGGICCDASSPTIRNNIIKGNTAPHYGGGISCVNGANPRIQYNVIDGNSADDGGGVSCDQGSSPRIISNEISGNVCNNWGGGIYSIQGSPTISQNRILNNTTGIFGHGGGIFGVEFDGDIRGNYIYSNSASQAGAIHCFGEGQITNNQIYNNEAAGSGGGVTASHVVFTNNTLIGNTAAVCGGGVCIFDNCSLNITNSIIWNNEAPSGPEIKIVSAKWGSELSIRHSAVKGGQGQVDVDYGAILYWGNGMIEDDPLFVDEAGDDLHLTYNSPCRNAGDNNAVIEPIDYEGDPRIAWNGTVDMGADEFHSHLYITGQKTPGGTIEGRLVGRPETSPVGLFLGSAILESSMPTAWGHFLLAPPWYLFGPLGSIPSDGILNITTVIPSLPPAPYDLYLQGLVGLNPDSLTNACLLEVR